MWFIRKIYGVIRNIKSYPYKSLFIRKFEHFIRNREGFVNEEVENLGWVYVFFAAFVEIFWVLGLKYSTNFLMWTGTVITIIFSFYFIIKACDLLPSGTVYAVFTGSGAAAIAIIDFTLLGAEFSIAKALFIGLIIVGVVGIQLTTSAAEKESDQVLPGREGN